MHSKSVQAPKIFNTTNIIRMTKVFSVFMLVFLFTSLLVINPIKVVAESLTEEKERLQTEANEVNKTLLDLKSQKNTLTTQLAIFDLQIEAIQAQIDSSQIQINLLTKQITELNIQIANEESNLLKQKGLLGELLKTLYINGQTSQLELILTSENFSDFVDKGQYLFSMQQQVTDIVTEIEKIKAELEIKKDLLEVNKSKAEILKASQIANRQAISLQAAEKQSLLNETKGSESNYQNILNNKAKRINEINNALNAAAGDGASSGTFYGVPYYSQLDSRWSAQNINYVQGSSMANYGCGVTSMSMIFASYGYYKDPGNLARNSKFFIGDLISWYNINWGTDGRFNVLEGVYGPANLTRANDWAAKSKPFIVAVNDAFGVGLDHYVVIIGQRNGGWVMNDPIRGGNLDFNNYYGFGSKYVEQTVFITP